MKMKLFGSRKPVSHQMRIQEERQFILNRKSDFFIREAYKALRTNVNFSLTGESKCKTMIVTSSLQSEGKSLTAVNLAISIAETDKKVILIDCDLRRPKLSRLIDRKTNAGLSNLLMDLELLPEVIQTGDFPVDVIFSGDIPPNPSELLGSSRMLKLLELLREKYDYIIMDTPPINMVTDAVVLGQHTDGVLFVVRANQSERGAVSHAVEQLEYAQIKILGFVLNGVDLEKTNYGYGKYRYKRYSRYGYGKGYGYGRGYGCGGYGGGYGYGYGYQFQPESDKPEQE